ncbi:MAG TPA: topoisomerase DNA-binding C4 zinc finger domain-containing protein [archaeon]|nr:topoisomerase DNA-binding C4 zinc finger domain-containing protein [archaeon]
MKCVECGKPASKLNSSQMPVCSTHAKSKLKEPNCPNCGVPMKIRKSKYGVFWGCTAFPMCDGMRKI